MLFLLKFSEKSRILRSAVYILPFLKISKIDFIGLDAEIFANQPKWFLPKKLDIIYIAGAKSFWSILIGRKVT